MSCFILAPLYCAGLGLVAGCQPPANSELALIPDAAKEIAKIRAEFGVHVHYIYDFETYFPSSWKSPPFSAQGSQIDLDESRRVVHLIPAFLKMYPPDLIKNDLHDIYLLGSMKFHGLAYGGTNSSDAIYLVSEGENQGYTERSLAGTMHSEFSSILLRNHRFPSKEWTAINDRDFKYAGEGKDLVDRPDARTSSDDILREGFTCVYGKASLEEDINMYVDSAIAGPALLASAAKKHVRVARKLGVLVQFYEGIGRELNYSGEFGLLTRLKSMVRP
jgi:hypothetical protein